MAHCLADDVMQIARLIGKCTGTDHCKDQVFLLPLLQFERLVCSQVVVTQNAVFPFWCAIITGSVKVTFVNQ